MKRWRSIISLLLVLVFVVQLMPLTSLAVDPEVPEATEKIVETQMEAEPVESTVPVSVGDDTPYIVGEVEERREEAVKHFRMSDGSFAMVQYSEPVHWKDTSGTWQEIDNTLSARDGRYVAENGAVTKSFAASMADGELFRISYGDFSVGMTYVVPSAAEKPVQPDLPAVDAAAEKTTGTEESDTQEKSDVTEADEESDEQSTAETEENADSLEKKIEDSAKSDNGESVEVSARDTVDQTMTAPASATIVPIEGTAYAVRRDAGIKASIENAPLKATANISVSNSLAQQTAPSKVQYKNADSNMDLLYENHGYNIKESILIHEPQEQYTYAFALDLQGLTPKLQDDGSILLQSKNGNDIFVIPAPMLEDANGVTSDAAKYTLKDENRRWILTVEADAKWMNEDDRAFPVQLDPSIIAKYGSNTVYSTYVRSFVPDMAGSDQEMYCGFNISAGECRVALQITNLPQIPSDCTPVAVGIAMYHAAYYNSSAIGSTAPTTPMLIEAHELTDGVMSIGTHTWNTLSSKVDSKVIDYQKLSRETCNTYVQWDISSAGLTWYANGSTNRGLIFIAPNAQAEQQTANISGSYFVSYSPVLIVKYRSAVGSENYYSYQQADAGRAGNVSINDFTHQMTVTHTDLTFNSKATPFTLTHVYNSERANQQFSSTTGVNTRDFTAMVVGSGWKLSAQQTIISKVIGDTTYLVYNDEDGTDHYFQKTAYNTYEDEDGLNLKIVTSGATYTMTDEDANNTWTFYNGYLISHRDLVGNMIYYAYNANYTPSSTAWKPNTGNGNQLVQIVSVPVGQSATTICTFGYTGWFLTSITDYAGRTTIFSIQGENYRNILKYIQYPDNNANYQSRYEYDPNNGWMRLIYDQEAQYGLDITQRTCQGVRTVDKVREYTAASVTGTKTYGNGFHAYRNSVSLTSYRFYGADHISDGDLGGDDIVLYNTLDHWGRTICSYETDSKKDTLLGVTAGAYTSNSGTNKNNNRLTSASSLGLQVENILYEVGAETDVEHSRWHPNNTAGQVATAQHIYNVVTSHTGNGSLHCKLTNDASDSQTVSFYQDVKLKQGETYIFSGFINTSFSAVPSSEAGAYLQISTLSGSQIHKSDIINYSTYTSQNGDDVDNYDNGWEKVSVSFTPSNTAQYRFSFVLCGAKGDAYADDFQLERHAAASVQNESIGASSTNLVTFGSFDGDLPEYTYNWTGANYSTAPSDFLLGSRCATTAGDTGTQRRLSQIVPINRSAANLTFVLSGWGKADSIASAVAEPSPACLRYFGLVATIKYTDGTTEDHFVSFSPQYADWQFASGNIVPKQPSKTVENITVSCAYDYNANNAYFDNISLVREPVQIYSYNDSDGTLKSATDGNAKSSVTYIPGTHRPQEYRTPTGITHTLSYTSNKLLATDTVSDLVTSNTYNPAGCLTAQIVKSNGNATYLQSNKAYTVDNYNIASSVDANGVAATFSYNAQRNLLTSQIDGKDVQGYDYFLNSDRAQQTYVSGKASIFYTYGNGALTQLQRKSFNGPTAFYQRYNFTNDSFGNNTKITVSGSTNGSTFSTPITLFSSTYETGVNNGRLKTETYPNGDAVTYTYDMFDRRTQESYTGTVTSTHNFLYDGMGNLAEKTAITGGQTERFSYQYDGLGRLYHSRAYANGAQTIGTTHLYDLENRLKQQSWTIGTNVAFTEKYQYSASDSTLSSLSVSTDIPDRASNMANINAVYSYTPVRQMQKKSFQYAGGEQFYRAFAYRTNTSTNRTTNQIEYMNYRMPDESLILGQKYGYDDTGRLRSVMPSTPEDVDTAKAVTYEYDGLGQLKKCVDKSSGSTVNYKYTYDTAGNIREAEKGSTTIDYAYENASWPDLLTKVTIGSTAKTIAYTTPGLPNNWYNGSDYTFTWKQGTQLATVNKSGTATTYSYDMEGIRNAKTVGSTTYHFDTLSGKVMHQTGAARELWFIYDENGQPYMMISKHGNIVWEYWYLLNAQGDVVGIVNRYRQLVAKYSYDPYGKITSEWINPNDTVGEINPLRYRGYFYDFETGFYYLQSRYYDPVIGRFISADCFTTTDTEGFLSCNMFAYCENDPVNREDPSGEFGLDAFVGGVVNAATSALSAKVTGGSTQDIITAAVFGFVAGAVRNSSIGTALNLGISIYNGIKVGIASGSVTKGALAGIISFGAGFVSSNSLQGAGLNVACNAAFDATFGLGAKLVSDGMNSGLSTRAGLKTNKHQRRRSFVRQRQHTVRPSRKGQYRRLTRL